MFNVNLNSNPGIQSDKISSSMQIDKPVEKRNITSNSNKKKENEDVNSYSYTFFIFIMMLFIIIMVFLTYFKGEILLLNNFIDNFFIKLQNNIN